MSSALAIIAFFVSQFLNFKFAVYVAKEFGPVPAIVVFVIIFGLCGFAIGKFAAKKMIVTYEDQRREKRR